MYVPGGIQFPSPTPHLKGLAVLKPSETLLVLIQGEPDYLLVSFLHVCLERGSVVIHRGPDVSVPHELLLL